MPQYAMATKVAMPEMAVAICLLLACLSPALGYKVATAADAVPSAMQAGTKYPQLSSVIEAAQMFSPDLVAYVQNPKTVCTIIAPDNKAMSAAMGALGEYSGLVLQNQTMVSMILNYHVIPGQMLKAEDLGTKVKAVNTREGEPMYFVQHGGVPYVADAKVYVQPIEIANIKAGGCIAHIVGQTLLAPPSLQPMMVDWLTKAGNASALQASKSLWLTELPPVTGTNSSAAAGTSARGATLDTNNGPAGSASQESAAQQPQSAKSGVGAVKASVWFKSSAVACAVLLLGWF